jgi:SAM-dependent methyltransferase
MDHDQPVAQILDDVIRGHENCLGENDQAFLRRVFSTAPETYEQRLRAIAFAGLERVLDAGCGFGQWTIALARLNEWVASLDVQPARIDVLTELLRRSGIQNVEARAGRLEALPYRDGFFDGVFCYISIFYADWRAALDEIVRVLRPGGRLYTTGNGLGWYLHLWRNRPHATPDYEPRDVVARTLEDTVEYERSRRPPTAQLIIEPDTMVEALTTRHLTIVARGDEGTIHVDRRVDAPRPFFSGCYFGQTGCYEVLAQKGKGRS